MFLQRCNTSFASSVAVVLLACVALTGCTPAQQQTTLQVVTEINAHIPEVVAAADTASATISALIPAEAPVAGVTDAAFDTAAKTLQALTASYIANPAASVLTQIQTAITGLEGQISAATLSAAGIKSTQSQQAVLAALKGLLTVVTVVFALIAPTLSTAQLWQLRESNTIHLARVRRYMDALMLQSQARASGVDLDRAFRLAEAEGF